MIDSLDISREQHFVYATLGHVARMLDGVRDGKVGYTTAVVDMHCNAAENAIESVLASVRKAGAEARLITYQREKANAVYDLTQRLPSPRPSAGLPATISPCAAE